MSLPSRRKQQPDFIRRIYDETVALLVESRNYMAYVSPRERNRTGGINVLWISCEEMLITSRLTQVMAWLLVRRAVQEGELPPEQATAEVLRISCADVCLDVSGGDDENLPAGLRSLLERSHRLYERAVRLERISMEREPANMCSEHRRDERIAALPMPRPRQPGQA